MNDANFDPRNQRVIPPAFGWEWVPKTWNLFLKQSGRLIGAFWLFIFVSVVASAIPIIGPFVSGMLNPLLLFGALKIADDADQGRKPRVGDLFSVFSQPEALRSLLSVCFVSALMMAGSMFIVGVLGGLMVKFKNDPMAVLPSAGAGFIALLLVYTFVTIFWFFAPGFVYFARVSGRKAMEASLVAAVINWRPFLLMVFVEFGILIAALMPLGGLAAIGRGTALASIVGIPEAFFFLFVFGPMHFCMPYFAFREIFPTSPPQQN